MNSAITTGSYTMSEMGWLLAVRISRESLPDRVWGDYKIYYICLIHIFDICRCGPMSGSVASWGPTAPIAVQSLSPPRYSILGSVPGNRRPQSRYRGVVGLPATSRVVSLPYGASERTGVEATVRPLRSDLGDSLVVLREGCCVLGQQRHCEVLRVPGQILDEGGDPLGVDRLERVQEHER